MKAFVFDHSIAVGELTTHQQVDYKLSPSSASGLRNLHTSVVFPFL